MISIASWNIRGLNRVPKQNEVKSIVEDNKLCLCAILESHVDIKRLLAASRQVMHCQVTSHVGNVKFLVSFIYANNYYIHRRLLWTELDMHKNFIGDQPWVLLGDFNTSLRLDESTARGSTMSIAMREFNDCVDSIGLSDINHTGLQYTSKQRPNLNTGILKKIDRVMANDTFLNDYANSYAIFQPYRISDHSPAILKIPSQGMVSKPKPFKFCNFVTSNAGFIDIVRNGWKLEVDGFRMFKVVKRLRALKKPLRKLSWQKGNIHQHVEKLRLELDTTQMLLDKHLDSVAHREEESRVLKLFTEAALEEEHFLKQKSKVDWL
ncbi:uncharacterized protein [Rutidosis leptorrhynchoides]|uniref:uncharacterized protein n=1 Tax=Rutidosis leptorrhynchoides TaxID=125765 RepID=UPI003A995111